MKHGRCRSNAARRSANPARPGIFPRVGVFYYAWLRPGPPLEKDRLLDALGQALAKSADLGSAWEHLSQQARETRKLHPALLFGRDPPKEMAGLRLSH